METRTSYLARRFKGLARHFRPNRVKGKVQGWIRYALVRGAFLALSIVADQNGVPFTLTVFPKEGTLDQMLRPNNPSVSKQPRTDVLDLASAITKFEEALPGWWWTCGSCSLTRHASCGPDSTGPDALLLDTDLFDSGFHCDDLDGSVADALRDVLNQALSAKRRETKRGRHT
jgi:hypothetical protein